VPATLFTGLFTGLSLIVAIGAQNAFVLQQGLVATHVTVVVTICAVSDLVLIIAGVSGVGALVQSRPAVLTALRFAGAAYLTWFGVRSLLAARSPHGLQAALALGRGSAVMTALALTWLNPHVYLDTVLMLGNLANQHGRQGRWWFAAGAGIGSIAWFALLGYGAGAASGWISKPSVWRTLDVLIAGTMFAIAGMLLLS
jgi:L-lysine exporter family protein LysE/ArgO